ncbi:hypothetical protein CYMTET_18191 [Cymbomonas tetramitiformis]|uniref:Uncharacterized protein n=1 Tax=Cymbomonas tetramitiformis TaxID=36881 RepID=A0AAE0G8K6_9CHLO|nr:hypothetical protein CYMTET_18191 [Cymbomonas tetramitiformis]
MQEFRERQQTAPELRRDLPASPSAYSSSSYEETHEEVASVAGSSDTRGEDVGLVADVLGLNAVNLSGPVRGSIGAHGGRREPVRLQCLDPTHPPMCTACRAPPPLEEESNHELLGEVGKKNGEKRLRTLLVKTPQWNNVTERHRLADIVEQEVGGEKLADVLRRKDSPSLRKAHLLYLTRAWGYKIDFLHKREKRGSKQAAAAAAAAAAALEANTKACHDQALIDAIKARNGIGEGFPLDGQMYPGKIGMVPGKPEFGGMPLNSTPLYGHGKRQRAPTETHMPDQLANIGAWEYMSPSVSAISMHISEVLRPIMNESLQCFAYEADLFEQNLPTVVQQLQQYMEYCARLFTTVTASNAELQKQMWSHGQHNPEGGWPPGAAMPPNKGSLPDMTPLRLAEPYLETNSAWTEVEAAGETISEKAIKEAQEVLRAGHKLFQGPNWIDLSDDGHRVYCSRRKGVALGLQLTARMQACLLHARFGSKNTFTQVGCMLMEMLVAYVGTQKAYLEAAYRIKKKQLDESMHMAVNSIDAGRVNVPSSVAASISMPSLPSTCPAMIPPPQLLPQPCFTPDILQQPFLGKNMLTNQWAEEAGGMILPKDASVTQDTKLY